MDFQKGAVFSECGFGREGLAAFLARAGVGSVESVGTLSELMGLLDAHPVDLVLVDLAHIVEDGRFVTSAIRLHPSRPKVLAIGSASQLAAASPFELALERPFADSALLAARLNHADFAAQLFIAAANGSPRPPWEDGHEWSRVTTRQREVLGWLAQGADNERIAKILRISIRTVKAHISSLMRRFDVENRTELALLAAEARVRPPPQSHAVPTLESLPNVVPS
jgi:DNA-binding NarL/FixJ family response regulator